MGLFFYLSLICNCVGKFISILPVCMYPAKKKYILKIGFTATSQHSHHTHIALFWIGKADNLGFNNKVITQAYMQAFCHSAVWSLFFLII